jgi:hypothetical protein
VTEVEVWYLHYYNTGTKTKGIQVCDSQTKAVKEMALLEKWEPFKNMKVSGPHKHEVS